MALDEVEQIDAVTRRNIATGLTVGRRDLIAQWERRHREQPLLAEPVEAQLGGWQEYRDAYLEPLLHFLAIGIRDASPEHLQVYAHERSRFLSPVGLQAGGRAQLAETFHGDTEDTALLFGDRVTEARAVRDLLDSLHAPIVSETGAPRMRIMMVGDCLFTEIASFLHPKLRDVELPAQIDHMYFSASQKKALSRDELMAALERERYDLLGLSFLTFEGIPPFVALMSESDRMSDVQRERRVDQIDALIREYIEDVRTDSVIPIVLHGCCGLPLRGLRRAVPVIPPLSRGRRKVIEMLNGRLRELADNTENVIFLDEERIVTDVGIRAAGEPIASGSAVDGAMFHPSVLGTILAERYLEVARARSLLSKCKVLLVDFDNTLWKGVMAEGGVEHDLTAQRLLRQLREAGILLVSVSKNDPESIRWDEMELDYSDFVLHKVSWNLKSQSIAEAAQQLDLGLDSFVLVDDNPVERELVTGQLPTVQALDPGDPATWRSLALMMDFPNTRRTSEAARRTEMYREAAARRDVLSGGADYPQMMRSLDLRVEFGPARAQDLDRVHELVERTNQFNTTTIRRTKAELVALMDDPSCGVFVATLSDKFGSLGIVGLSVVRRQDDTRVFESVIMSCRAMGFGFENVLLRGPIDAMAGARHARGHYVPTERNRPCASLFQEAGFTETAPGQWDLDLDVTQPEIPDWLTVDRL